MSLRLCLCLEAGDDHGELRPGSIACKPQAAKSLLDLCDACSIIRAPFLSYRSRTTPEPIGDFSPPIARFEHVATLGGEAVPVEFEVRYDFDDGSACLVPEGWSFASRLMPAESSEWLLFQTAQEEGTYRTYQGDFGRIPLGSLSSYLLDGCAGGAANGSTNPSASATMKPGTDSSSFGPTLVN